MMVTGPVSMPFIGRFVSDCACCAQATVIGCGRLMSPNRMGGFTQRDP